MKLFKLLLLIAAFAPVTSMVAGHYDDDYKKDKKYTKHDKNRDDRGKKHHMGGDND